MSSIRHTIISLYQQGFLQCDIVKSLCCPKQTVSKVIKRFNELGHYGDRPGRGRKCTVNTPKNRNIIRSRVRRNPKVSMRKIAVQTGLKRESVRKIAKNVLKLKPYKMREAQLLTDNNKTMRLQRCRALLRRFAAKRWENLLFTDEKVFTLEQYHNSQNDRIWSQEAPTSSRIVTRRQYPQSVMVFGGICATGKTPLIFVTKGIKINKDVYCNILKTSVLPWAQQHFRNQHWTFQQDSAPAHKAKITQEWCQANFPDFVTSQQWPPYSPDLNAMDYTIWSLLEARACRKPHKSLEALKKSLLREWDKISLEELRSTAENFTKRLKLCIKAEGGYFENS